MDTPTTAPAFCSAWFGHTPTKKGYYWVLGYMTGKPFYPVVGHWDNDRMNIHGEGHSAAYMLEQKMQFFGPLRAPKIQTPNASDQATAS